MKKEFRSGLLSTNIMSWRILGLLLLSLLWLKDNGGEAGVVLLLFLSIMTLARWRFSLPLWTVLLDQLACLIAIPFWQNASFALMMPIFETVHMGQPWFVLPGIISIIAYSRTSILLIVVLIQAAFSGWAIGGWTRKTELYRQEADRQRRDRYELESLKSELLLANTRVAKMAELTERNRIARELHDHVGHELTAAVLALQAFEQLWKEKDPQAVEMFYLAQERLCNSAIHLRDTVHDMKPVIALGIEQIEEICHGFSVCPIKLDIYGDTTKVPAYLWSILEPCLKEALTNISRHSKAHKVEVSIDVSHRIVRLCIHDDGAGGEANNAGMGLRNLRQRAQAVGGSISIDASSGFRLICVLPFDERRAEA
jgi:signal transduction histidine kinase